MSALRVLRSSRNGSAALMAAALSMASAAPVSAAAECPDDATVSAAQLLEFKTMMMVVGLRCKSVGVMMADHNEDLAAARSTMFDEADGRVRRYLKANDQPAPVVQPLPVKTTPVKLTATPAGKRPLASASKPQAPVKAAPPRSRREDPYEKYLTRVGQTYGMGSNSIARCRQFDSIALWLADKTSPSRLLTKVANEMIGSPLLERQAGCARSR